MVIVGKYLFMTVFKYFGILFNTEGNRTDQNPWM